MIVKKIKKNTYTYNRLEIKYVFTCAYLHKKILSPARQDIFCYIVIVWNLTCTVVENDLHTK